MSWIPKWHFAGELKKTLKFGSTCKLIFFSRTRTLFKIANLIEIMANMERSKVSRSLTDQSYPLSWDVGESSAVRSFPRHIGCRARALKKSIFPLNQIVEKKKRKNKIVVFFRWNSLKTKNWINFLIFNKKINGRWILMGKKMPSKKLRLIRKGNKYCWKVCL